MVNMRDAIGRKRVIDMERDHRPASQSADWRPLAEVVLRRRNEIYFPVVRKLCSDVRPHVEVGSRIRPYLTIGKTHFKLNTKQNA